MSRAISLSQAKAKFVHRYTMEHKPKWAEDPFTNGLFPAPQFHSDKEWYDNTLFHGESQIEGLTTKSSCYTTGQTWPLGTKLTTPFNPNKR